MIRHILFDLDCTLYSVKYGFEEQVGRRIREFTASFLGLPIEVSEPLRKEGLKKYGTTLGWLTIEKGFTAINDFQTYAHPENEADNLPPDPQLRRFLEELPCPCSVLTNSPGFHADRFIKKLGLEGVFYRVFTLDDNELRGKPYASAFNRALDSIALKPEEVLFIDDHPSYVEGYLALGGRGILIDELGVHTDYPHERIKDLRELTRFLG